jgi:hypothetical protein
LSQEIGQVAPRTLQSGFVARVCHFTNVEKGTAKNQQQDSESHGNLVSLQIQDKAVKQDKRISMV